MWPTNPKVSLAELQRSCVQMVETSRGSTMSAYWETPERPPGVPETAVLPEVATCHHLSMSVAYWSSIYRWHIAGGTVPNVGWKMQMLKLQISTAKCWLQRSSHVMTGLKLWDVLSGYHLILDITIFPLNSTTDIFMDQRFWPVVFY